MSSLEQTLSIIKPDAVERNLGDKIKDIFIKNKLNIIESKKICITKVGHTIPHFAIFNKFLECIEYSFL